MRVWFQGGPLDGYEFDLSSPIELAPHELFVALREMNPAGPPPIIDHGAIATYERIEDVEGGYREVRR
jgi:hypothetical protein